MDFFYHKWWSRIISLEKVMPPYASTMKENLHAGFQSFKPTHRHKQELSSLLKGGRDTREKVQLNDVAIEAQ